MFGISMIDESTFFTQNFSKIFVLKFDESRWNLNIKNDKESIHLDYSHLTDVERNHKEFAGLSVLLMSDGGFCESAGH